MIHLLKYDRMEPIARPLGARMAAQVAAQPGIPRAMTLVPVPLHRAKRRERGFNQAELLAHAVAAAGRQHGFTLHVETRWLRRRKATESQAGLSLSARRRNLAGAFAVSGAQDGAKPLAGRDLLLIDDIFTSGATARAASAVLRRAGAREVWVATAARAQREELVERTPGAPVRMEDDVAVWE